MTLTYLLSMFTILTFIICSANMDADFIATCLHYKYTMCSCYPAWLPYYIDYSTV